MTTRFSWKIVLVVSCSLLLLFRRSHCYRTNDNFQQVTTGNDNNFLIWIDTNTTTTTTNDDNNNSRLGNTNDNTTTTNIPIRSAMAHVDVTHTGIPLEETTSITVVGGLLPPMTQNNNNPQPQSTSTTTNGTLVDSEQWLQFVKTRAYRNPHHGHWIWQGMVPMDSMEEDGDGTTATSFGYATFVETEYGCIAGTFTSYHSVFTMTCLPDGTIRVDQILWEDFPQQTVPNVEEDAVGNAADYYYEDDGIVINPAYEEFMAVLKEVAITSEEEEEDIEADSTNNNSSIPDVSSTWATGQITSDFFLPSKSQTHVLDLLVIVTNAAMCQQAGQPVGCSATDYKQPIEDALALAEAQTTSAMQDVNVNAAIRIVKIYHDTTGYDVRLFADDNGKVPVLDNLAKPLDKKLGYVRQMRKNVGADLVTLVSTVGNICGVGAAGPFSAVALECLGGYSLTHEIGHCLGCRHNVEDGSSKVPKAYWHGHRVPGQFSTVMSYACEPDGLAACPRIPVFSAFGENYVYNTFPLGSSRADNARLLRKTTPLVAKFKDPCPCPKENFVCRIAYKCCRDCREK